MNFLDDSTLKKILYTFVGVLIFSIIVLVAIFMWYDNKLSGNAEEYSLEVQDYINEDNTKEASSTEDKNIVEKSLNINNEIDSYNIENKVNSKPETNKVIKTPKKEEVKEENETPKEVKKELKFEAPVAGEIIKDFASETLEYSKTLDEWTTHLGIDIKGEKTSIVKASEEGTIESIKNDPRYGLTITICHSDGFKTVYSNLLTTEFVAEGDKVSKGDTIATIGETASFEILDESHLHFEMYKDESPVNPTLYLK